MRKDMHKILVEPPRRGRDAEIRVKGRASRNPDDLPFFQSMRDGRRRGWNRKEATTNTNPLRRFLNSRVGRPWDEVHAELCAGNDARNRVKAMVRKAALSCVETQTWVGDDGNRYTGSLIGPLRVCDGDLYVDEDGILRRAGDSASNRRRQPEERQPPLIVEVDEGRRHQKLDGLWYEVLHRPVPPARWTETRDPDGNVTRTRVHDSVFDVVEGRLVSGRDTVGWRRRTRYAYAKRQLGRGELRACGLENDGELAGERQIDKALAGGDRKDWRRRLALRLSRPLQEGTRS